MAVPSELFCNQTTHPCTKSEDESATCTDGGTRWPDLAAGVSFLQPPSRQKRWAARHAAAAPDSTKHFVKWWWPGEARQYASWLASEHPAPSSPNTWLPPDPLTYSVRRPALCPDNTHTHTTTHAVPCRTSDLHAMTYKKYYFNFVPFFRKVDTIHLGTTHNAGWCWSHDLFDFFANNLLFFCLIFYVLN